LEQAWHERQRIWQFAKDLLNAATKGKFRIYAFGPGGAGKTTLAQLLSGEYSLETVPPDYNLSLELEDHGVEGRNFVAVYVPPGQDDKKAFHWDELYRLFAESCG
jgi:GTPase SAR1 family protein